MKIFNKTQKAGWSDKVNFVDENNVMLGYDDEGQCSEDFGWAILDTVSDSAETIQENERGIIEMEGWTFDTSFFEKLPAEDNQDMSIAVFKITKGSSEKFVHIYNAFDTMSGI